MTEHIITARQRRLIELWEQHVGLEFDTRNTEATLDTMVPQAYVNHVPVMTGGRGRDELREFSGNSFIPRMPPDTRMTPISRTVDDNRLVDEMIFEFTHTIPMPWMLPGVSPTGKPVKVALVAIVGFDGDRLANEHIYWDQASVLVQLGMLDPKGLPVCGAESADKALDPTLPPRTL
jgi:carboxymethylenebutenolidase